MKVWRGTRKEFREARVRRLSCNVIELTDETSYNSYLLIPGNKEATDVTWCILIESESV